MRGERKYRCILMALSMVGQLRSTTMVDCECSRCDEITVPPTVTLGDKLLTYNIPSLKYERAVHRNSAALWRLSQW